LGTHQSAGALGAAAQGVQSLGVFRFLLGLGEAGVWPAASKVVSEWFPAKERALAIGAARAHVIDVREEFADSYLLPALQAGALDGAAATLAGRAVISGAH
jgi:hypothetical protein